VTEQVVFWSAYQSSARSTLGALSLVALLARLVRTIRGSPTWVAEEKDSVTVWTWASRG
jgi:hypothetical protein